MPFFSICVPQYNRTSFLIEACKSLQDQTFAQFEVCISDDCSTDGRQDELISFLQSSGLSFSYTRHRSNLRYDANLRSAIHQARGQFAFLLGNDDCLASPTVLEELHRQLQVHDRTCVVISNYEDFKAGRRFARVGYTGMFGSGPRVAVSAFRNFSFLSGIALRTDKAHEHASSRWDGSEMYQMFLGSRIIAAGGALLCVDAVTVRKDIHIQGETVDSYATRPRITSWAIAEQRLPLVQVGRLVVDATEPYEPGLVHCRSIETVFRQLYLFTFPFWIVEYRRVQSWPYAIGVCLGLRPRNSLGDIALPRAARLRLSLLFWTASLAALLIPARVFAALHWTLYRAAKALH
jgi:hypothetical protein